VNTDGDVTEANRWVRSRIPGAGALRHVQTEPWAVVHRAETEGGPVWFKACAPHQAFEVPLTASLSERWPRVAPEVLAYDLERRWLLMADGGEPLRVLGNPPERWLEILPEYARLQIGEIGRVPEHLARGVPDLRPERLPARYDDLLAAELPVDVTERAALDAFRPRLRELCEELDGAGVGPSVQHDDLHMNNVYLKDGSLKILDWGDASIGHPFFSLFETFRFLGSVNGLAPDDAWFARLRDAYLAPWGSPRETFELAMRLAGLARAIAWLDQREALLESDRADFDVGFDEILRLAMRRALGSPS